MIGIARKGIPISKGPPEQTIMLQMSQKTKTKNRIEERRDPITEMERDATNKTLGEIVMTENPETSEGNLAVLVGCVQRPHTQTCLDAQISKSTFQANQEN